MTKHDRREATGRSVDPYQPSLDEIIARSRETVSRAAELRADTQMLLRQIREAREETGVLFGRDGLMG